MLLQMVEVLLHNGMMVIQFISKILLQILAVQPFNILGIGAMDQVMMLLLLTQIQVVLKVQGLHTPLLQVQNRKYSVQ